MWLSSSPARSRLASMSRWCSALERSFRDRCHLRDVAARRAIGRADGMMRRWCARQRRARVGARRGAGPCAWRRGYLMLTLVKVGGDVVTTQRRRVRRRADWPSISTAPQARATTSLSKPAPKLYGFSRHAARRVRIAYSTNGLTPNCAGQSRRPRACSASGGAASRPAGASRSPARRRAHPGARSTIAPRRSIAAAWRSAGCGADRGVEFRRRGFARGHRGVRPAGAG